MSLVITHSPDIPVGNHTRRCDQCGWTADFIYPIQITLNGRPAEIVFCLACVQRELDRYDADEADPHAGWCPMPRKNIGTMREVEE